MNEDCKGLVYVPKLVYWEKDERVIHAAGPSYICIYIYIQFDACEQYMYVEASAQIGFVIHRRCAGYHIDRYSFLYFDTLCSRLLLLLFLLLLLLLVSFSSCIEM